MSDLKQSATHVVLAGGGTGGHLFPGLAVAEELRRQAPQMRLTFAGTGRSFERRHVAAAGFEFLALRCRPAPSSWWRAGQFVLANLAGYRAASQFIKKTGVSLVVGLGGYASAPMARAAVSRGIPLILLEQNAVAGRVTRWLAPSASLVCLAFEEARQGLPTGGPLRVTGNPVRAAFSAEKARDNAVRIRPVRRLVVLGGSHGARDLNRAVPQALQRLKRQLRDWRIIHQSGREDHARTVERYRRRGLPAEVTPFIEDVPSLLAAADLAICRAGGTTLAELAITATPAVLVPYPYAKDDHQRKNADALVAAGAARCVDSRDDRAPLSDRLAMALGDLISDAHPRKVLAGGMRKYARPDAAWQVAAIIRDLLGRNIRAVA